MAISSPVDVSAEPTSSAQHEHPHSDVGSDRQLSRWGGRAALAGVVLLAATGAVVGALGLPDADDVETLRDFADIESGRIVEHFLYLGALMMFALHVLVLYRLLTRAHPAASLFGATLAEFGLAMMAASSLLHVATTPLADLYTAPDTPSDDLRSIEYAWHGAQSVFDTMLMTGVLLASAGIVLFGVAMRRASTFGPRIAWLSIGLGAVGATGAAIEIVDGDLGMSAVGVVAIAIFHLTTGWRTLKLGQREGGDVTDPARRHA